jgi:maleylacetate reductase
MIEFNYKALHWNIVFAVGSLHTLPNELDKLGKKRALILTTPNQAEQGRELAELLGDRAVGLFDQAAMHVPAATLEAATQICRSLAADCTVALGGGSTIGLGKALAVEEGLDNIVIPTSYAGSEMTDIWAVTGAERKVTARNYAAVPTLTLYDPQLTLTLPPEFSAASGLNAMAQAVVNVATDKPSPIISSLAVDGIRALAASLPMIMKDPQNIEARSQALYGASMAGGALGTGITSLHHRLCHTFGGTFNTPHAETHAILLAHSVAYNAAATSEGTARVADALGVDNAAQGIYQLAKKLGVPLSLKEVRILESDLDKAVAVTLENPLSNPEPVTPKRLRQLLDNAWHGSPPQAIKA